jgi:hypothetical protein
MTILSASIRNEKWDHLLSWRILQSLAPEKYRRRTAFKIFEESALSSRAIVSPPIIAEGKF